MSEVVRNQIAQILDGIKMPVVSRAEVFLKLLPFVDDLSSKTAWLAEKNEWLRVREQQVRDAASVIERLETELAEARERVDYFRASRDRNAEALDAARATLETLRSLLETCVGDTVTLT